MLNISLIYGRYIYNVLSINIVGTKRVCYNRISLSRFFFLLSDIIFDIIKRFFKLRKIFIRSKVTNTKPYRSSRICAKKFVC